MELTEVIQKRRAHRSLDPVEITDELMKNLAKNAQLSPSCFNKQPWRFIFVKSRDKLTDLFSALNKGNLWAQKASMIIGIFSEIGSDCQIKDRNYFLFDTGMATAFLILRATELGLVAHPIAGYDEIKAKEILKIPDNFRLITLIIVGRKSVKINPNLSEKQIITENERPTRLPLEKFLFIDNYGQNLMDK